jgi:CRISPR type III-A-associated protein Csm2
MQLEEMIKQHKTLSNFDPIQLDKYCFEKGKLFAKGEEKKDKKGYTIQDNKVSTSQLRNVFSRITSIRSHYKSSGRMMSKEGVQQIRRDLALLKPMLAYAKGKDPKLVNFVEEMRALIDIAIVSLDAEVKEKPNGAKFDSLENYFAIVEGFIAYHKYHGGKE